MVRVIGMFSGGLDSLLAARIMKGEGCDVTLLHFYTGFNEPVSREVTEGPGQWWSPRETVVRFARRLDVPLVPVDVSGEYLDIVLHPRHGYGSGVNPCIDCRIFLLGKAREIMESEGAVCVFTGEVLGQRPMSQHRPSLRLVEKRSGLEGRLLRPLSAKLLDSTVPEREGLIHREHLFDISGRSRKRQQELAAAFGIADYPSSGGGCILTDENFKQKFADFYDHSGGRDISIRDLHSFKTGRHLRLAGGTKLIVGRTEAENLYLERLLANGSWMFETRDFPGAAVFAMDEPHEDDFHVIAAICARYGKGRNHDSVTVAARKGDVTRELTVKPAEQHDIDSLFI